jgi:hypothetical protein
MFVPVDCYCTMSPGVSVDCRVHHCIHSWDFSEKVKHVPPLPLLRRVAGLGWPNDEYHVTLYSKATPLSPAETRAEMTENAVRLTGSS